jgi:hypothetical protein
VNVKSTWRSGFHLFRTIARKVAAHLFVYKIRKEFMMKKLLTIVASVYVGGVASAAIMMLPFAEPLECLMFGAIWPYVAVRMGIYTLFGV